MNYFLATLLTLLDTVGLLLVALGLPGTWLMVAATLLLAWWRWDTPGTPRMFGLPVLVTIVVLALLGEVLEFLAGVLGSRTAGGSRKGALGALLGTFVGGVLGTFIIPIPVLGTLIGACAGAALGAWAMELRQGRDLRAAATSGLGAGLGRLAGTGAKLAVAILIWVIVAVAAFWP